MTDTLETLAPAQRACPDCQEMKPLTAFGKNVRMKDGLQFYCKDCSNRRINEWKQANPKKAAASQSKYYQKNRAACLARRKRLTDARKASLVKQFKSGPCMDCGQTYPPYVMDFDHRPGTNKQFNLAGTRIVRWGLEVILDEIAKCDLVCANCHRVRTHKRLKDC